MPFTPRWPHVPRSYTRFRDKPPGEKHDNPAFAAMLFDLDEAIGKIMELVRKLGIDDNTYIVVMGDNGGVAYMAQTSRIDAEANILESLSHHGLPRSMRRCEMANIPSTRADSAFHF